MRSDDINVEVLDLNNIEHFYYQSEDNQEHLFIDNEIPESRIKDICSQYIAEQHTGMNIALYQAFKGLLIAKCGRLD